MFNNNVILFISSFDLQLGQKCAVSRHENMYSELSLLLNEHHTCIEQALEELFTSSVSMGYGWVRPVLFDVQKIDDIVNIYYACSIPPQTELVNSYYINNNIALIHKQVRKALSYV